MAKPFCMVRAFKPSEMVDVCDQPLAHVAALGCDQCHAAGRHVDDLAREFPTIGQHIAAKEADRDALVAAAFLGV
jgi:hypothetical protein